MKINLSTLSNIITATNALSKAVNTAAVDSDGKGSNQYTDSANNSVKTNITTSINTQAKLLTLEQNAVLLRELLDIPQELSDFIKLFVTSNDESIETLLKNGLTQEVLNEQLNLANIQQFLDNNAKDVINKLLKIIQQDFRNPQASEQLKDILNALNQVLPQNKTQQQDTLKAIILLYLPWLPLPPPKNLKIGVEANKNGQSEEGEEYLVIVINTIAFGQLKVSLSINQAGQLKINIEFQEEKTGKNFKLQIIEKIHEEIEKLKITPTTTFSPLIKSKEGEDPQRSISFQQISAVSQRLMLSAYAIIKIIFEFDDKEALLAKRKKIIDK